MVKSSKLNESKWSFSWSVNSGDATGLIKVFLDHILCSVFSKVTTENDIRLSVDYSLRLRLRIIKVDLVLRVASRREIDPAIADPLSLFFSLCLQAFFWSLKENYGLSTLFASFEDVKLDRVFDNLEAFEELVDFSFFGTPRKSSHFESALGIRV